MLDASTMRPTVPALRDRAQQHGRTHVVVTHVRRDVVQIDTEPDLRRLVADRVDAVQRPLDRRRVADVVAVAQIEHADVVAGRAQGIDHVRADEAGAAGHEDHGSTVGARPLPRAPRHALFSNP